MYKRMMFAVLILSRGAHAESTISAGVGAQYGGLLGVQYSYVVDNSQFRGAVGLFGATIGYDYLIDQLSLGFTYGSMFDARDAKLLSANYYFGGKYQEGWRLGLDVGRAAEYNDETDASLASISIGYVF